VIDALAKNSKDLEAYQLVFKNYKTELLQLEQLKSEQIAANRELDYNRFLFDELEEANFSENEIENIEAEIRLMSNAENIKSTLSQVYYTMEEGEQPLLQEIKVIHQKLQSLQKLYPEIELLNQRLSSAHIELKDIASEIDSINARVNYDEEKISRLNDRMAVGYALLKKHNVNTTAQLIEIKNNLEAELEKVTNLSEAIAMKEKMAQQYFDDAVARAKSISAKRQKEIPSFEEKVNRLLVQMGMPNAKIKIEISHEENLNAFGADKIEFLFNANLSSTHRQFEPVRKVASGGELSRLMLSIKSLVANRIQLPTLIFDEIDSGISGEAARQVGIIIKQLSTSHQVIAITHQPQIAAKANTHFFVYKEIKEDKIATAIKILDEDERITAIATMLSGKKPTAAAFENAKEMMER